MNFTYHHLFEPATDPKAPPLLLLHGTGGDEHDLVPLARRLSPGSALLSPRGDVSEHGARRFFARLAEGVFDPAEVTRRTHTLADFAMAATNHYQLETARLVAVGFSNGANIAATLLQLRPATLAGGVLLRPMVVLDQPAATGSLTNKRVLIASGTQDPIVPNDHPPHLAELLRAGGAAVTLHQSPAGHGLTTTDIAAAQKYFADR
ncbi:MAG: alpha/beta hydrolase [Opitutaceae bacterium]|jgi:phospholipase/carboxylesterase|nr:alpha/beta hydrolase [Opitutaceae bacterium]